MWHLDFDSLQEERRHSGAGPRSGADADGRKIKQPNNRPRAQEKPRGPGMEPWVPQWQSQPRGRPMAPQKDPQRGPQNGQHGGHWPTPRHSAERLPQRQDARGSPQLPQDPRMDCQPPHFTPRPGEWPPPTSRVSYYEGGYPGQPYSRPGYEDPYQRYHSPTLREEYAYGSYYYHGHSQRLREERVPRQGSPYIWHEDYGDPKYLSDHHHETRHSPFGANSETQMQSTNWNSYKDSLASSTGQERPGDLSAESQLAGAQKDKRLSTSKSNLVQQHESGLSSSSYELSQYMADVPDQYDPAASAAWLPVGAGDISAVAPKAPMKFYIPHVAVSFGPGGQLVYVCPSSPTDGQTALVELHSMEVILSDSEEQEEMRSFSGPLIRQDIHKVDVMTFCQQKAAQSQKSEAPGARDSALLWQLLVLLCRQNGSMVGSDIAELLVQDCKKLDKYKRQTPVANLISLADEDWPLPGPGPGGSRNLLTGEVPPTVDTPGQVVEKFTKLLYYGRKKEALEWAMKNHLWGHALFLSSKMDPRTYNWVMSGFTSTLALNDPLQTLFQLMSGRIPQAATCCGDTQWGDWRPHLAVILSNEGGDPELHQRAIVTMGDTLAGRGLVEAAHFCYLMARVPFGHYAVKTDRLALLGSSHSQEFLKFATTEAIQRTEIFEYCRMLGRPQSFIPSFQVYKLLYASRLADYGLASQALHYCEAIGAAVLGQGDSGHPVLLAELIKLAERLKLSDPLALERRRGDRDVEPDWLVQLRGRLSEQQKAAGDIGDPHSDRLDISGAGGTMMTDTLSQDRSGHQGYSDAAGYHSAAWPTQPSPAQPVPLPLGTPVETPVPLYSVPDPRLPGASIGGTAAVTGTPAVRGWEETPQIPAVPGEDAVSLETSPPPDDPEAGPTAQFQAPLASRAQSFSESNTVSASREAGQESLQNSAPREKLGDQKEPTKSSGFGWFSWFRSKPTDTSGDEDSSSDSSSDSEEPTSASSPAGASPGISPTPPVESSPLPGPSAFPRGTAGAGLPGPLPAGDAAQGAGSGEFSGLQSVSSEPYSAPGVLPPPPTLQGAVPLYNPSQVPQLSMTTSPSRANRLAQRRYPTQPC